MTDIELTKNTVFKGSATIGKNLTIGGRADISGDVRLSHDLRVEGWLDARNIRGAGVGFFESVEKLEKAYPEPKNGWYALVGEELPAEVYRAYDGQWIATGKTGGEPSIDYDKAKQVALDLETETNARITDDNELKNAIEAEAKTREEADTSLTEQLGILSESITQEEDRRKEADANLTNYIDTKIFDSEQIADYAISEEKLEDEAVSTDKIADGAVTEEKLSPAMRKLIEGWNGATTTVGTLPDNLVSEIEVSATQDEVTLSVTSYTKNDQGEYEKEEADIAFPSATTERAGTISAEDQRVVEELKANGSAVKPLSEDDINKITQ